MKPGVLQRVVAAEAVQRIADDGAFSNIVVRQLSPDLDASERSGVHHTILETLRNLIRWDAAIEAASERPVSDLDPTVRALLRVIAQELLGDGHAAHGVVDSAVDAATELGSGRAKGFVNAVGRKLATMEAPSRPGDGGFAFGIPQWMFDRVAEARGAERARAFFEAANQPARVGIRVRPGLPMPAEATPVEGIVGAAYMSRPQIADGIELIDPASTAVVLAVQAERGMAVADLAAAPGGKTAALWDAMEGVGRLVAVDIHERRMERTRRRLEELGVDAHTIVADARNSGLESGVWDRVLLDAPCTGLGTMRRRPEIRHRVRPENPAALGRLQVELVTAGLELVRPGGRLVYSVCTVFPEETIAVVDGFDAHPADLPGEVWGKGRLLGPDTTGTDGMFVSVIEKASP